MEKTTKLKTDDGYVIYGVLNTSAKKSNTLVIFVHGLTGDTNEHTFFNAAHQFPKKNVDVFRFSLYTGETGGRSLSDCTIATHSKDLDQVVNYYRGKYKTIAVVGHSLGSPTILKSDISKIDSIVLWDPSHLTDSRMVPTKKVKVGTREMRSMQWGTEFLISPAMLKEWQWFNARNELDLVSGLNKPLKIIAAGKGILKDGSKKYFKVAQEPKDLVVIPGATHCFDEEGKEVVLLAETLEWVKKYSK